MVIIENLSEITAGSPMVRTPINLVQRPISPGPIKDLWILDGDFWIFLSYLMYLICVAITLFSHRLPVVSKCHFFTAFTYSLIHSSFLSPISFPPPSAGMVDVVFADVAQPDQARILALNCHHFLKNQGHFVISIKVCML